MSEKNAAPRRAAHSASRRGSRRRSRSRARRSRRHTHRNGVLGLGAVAVFLVCTGMVMHYSDPSDAVGTRTAATGPTPAVTPVRTAPHPAAPSPSTHSSSPSPPTRPSSPSPSTRPSSPSPSTSTSAWFPGHGTGAFIRADGGTKAFGRGQLLRYAVDVEGGLRQDPEKFARQVDTVLDDTTRGWAAGGQWSFQRVSTGPVDFTVHLASPGTTDTLCAKYGLDTGGWVNCSGGDDVVINVKRWLLLTKYYKGQPDQYHALAVNHEVGHRLGHNHVGCPGLGKPAPAMMQQIKGLYGCVINGWPYDGRGRLITGPAAP